SVLPVPEATRHATTERLPLDNVALRRKGSAACELAGEIDDIMLNRNFFKIKGLRFVPWKPGQSPAA
ncbi:MAG: hypothetical protein OXU72_00465, partial [Gammaproteobacteria bacterium]|nr:hypothetical protein [Gammaproteobacteria bacterium]